MSMQLEFFPRKEFRTLFDFQEILSLRFNPDQLKDILSQPNFFKSPKSNEAISLKHSKLIDEILEFRCEFCEQMLVEDAFQIDPFGNHETWGPKLYGGVQSWIGLSLDTLQTPYSEIFKTLQELKLRPYQTVIDVGAAYGRLGVIIGALFLKNTFIGFEFIKSRVDEGNRIFKKFQFNKSQLFQADLGGVNFHLPEADIYFLYDFGQIEHIEKILFQIQKISHKRPIKMAVKGKYTKSMIEKNHSWANLISESGVNIYSAFEN